MRLKKVLLSFLVLFCLSIFSYQTPANALLINGEIADADDVNNAINNIANVPIGAVIAWFDSIPGVPALPDNFVACDGQTLDNDASPIDGQVIPDLNGGNRFLRGNSTAGGTGGESTHTLTAAELPSHYHVQGFSNASGGVGLYGNTTVSSSSAYTLTSSNTSNANTSSVGSGSAHENKPPYTNVVWIMRIY